jgi:hypothetical protein
LVSLFHVSGPDEGSLTEVSGASTIQLSVPRSAGHPTYSRPQPGAGAQHRCRWRQRSRLFVVFFLRGLMTNLGTLSEPQNPCRNLYGPVSFTRRLGRSPCSAKSCW